MLELFDIEPVMSKVYDCYNAHKIFLMGSFATYHCLEGKAKERYAKTMKGHDIDIFIIGNTVTGVDKVLLSEYVGLIDCDRVANHEYYKMPGLRKVLSYKTSKGLKFNFIFLSPHYYSSFSTICYEGMGHDLAKCGFYYNNFDCLNPNKVTSMYFIEAVRRGVVGYKPNLLNSTALGKFLNRLTALRFIPKES